ncbi:MAG TPA: lipoate--protein ligase [Bacteroidales bacterium]|nr:lipoate--protein ligase [Bacteroidales bacterium]HBZ19916.1 lipoate--protein ligase [Bacteroidales bacterium]
MFCLTLNSTDPYFNLAVDEYLLKNTNGEYLILSINDKSVIIGKHQSAHRETDTKFISEHNLPLVRRISGGGTVFHDMGNLNFTFVLNSKEGKQIDFRKYTLPVIGFLSTIGVDAKFEGKNDLKAGGLKISGNAEHVFRNRVLHHGTLLFDSDLELMRGALRKDASKYETRAVRSNPASVTNLLTLVNKADNNIDTIYKFRSLMLDWILINIPGSHVVELSEKEIADIKSLAETKYRTWEWNYAYGPEYDLLTGFVYGKTVNSCNLHVKDGIIWDVEIKGSTELEKAGKELIGCRHMPDDIQKVLEKENIFKQDFDIFNFF